MKNIVLLFVVVLLCAGCSKQEERSEKVGEEIANQIKAPISQTQAITDKIVKMRETENDLTP